MVSIRWVTEKPPKMLIEATKIAKKLSADTIGFALPTCNIAPTRIIPEMALVSLINGVWSEWVTAVITYKPTTIASIKMK